jgi:hypothetical protein
MTHGNVGKEKWIRNSKRFQITTNFSTGTLIAGTDNGLVRVPIIGAHPTVVGKKFTKTAHENLSPISTRHSTAIKY